MDHPFGWLSVLPPVVAIGLAIATRRVVVSLLAGIFVGALILSNGNVWDAVQTMCVNHLWPALASEDKLQVFAFTTLMGVMVGIISRAAGMKGLVERLAPMARSRRGGQLTTWFLGLFVFFDDYANTLLLGNTLRPLCDRLRISREKLAYLVDSTAAPVSGLALVSTWVAGEIGYIQDGLDKLPSEVEWSALELFLESIPYRFYVLWALIMVPLVALLNRDFGAMRSAEERAVSGEAARIDSPAIESPTRPDPATPARWYNAVVPIAATVAAIIWLMYRSGRAEFGVEESPSLMQVFGEADAYGSLLWGALAGAVLAAIMVWAQRLLTARELKQAAAAGGLLMFPALVILWLASALSGMTGNSPSAADAAAWERAETAAVADSLGVWEATHDVSLAAERLREYPQHAESIVAALIKEGAPAGELAEALARLGVPADLVQSWLVAAGAPIDGSNRVVDGQITGAGDPESVEKWGRPPFAFADYRLYTGAYLSSLLQDRLPYAWLPTIIFILSAAISFSTGTSWGTMGIVMPLAIPLVYRVGIAGGLTADAEHPVVVGAVGAVLAGAIFGDHCSPISDTTILSSQASGCDHVAHVWTQLPYALVVAALAVGLGTIPTSLGVSVWLVLPLGVVAMAALLWWVGKPVGGP